MDEEKLVPMFVMIPSSMRMHLKIAAARRDSTLGKTVLIAIQAFLATQRGADVE